MTVTRKAPARKPASKSGNPATAAAAKRREAESAELDAAVRAEQAAAVRREFETMTLPAPVFDEEGYEVIPDKSQGEGSYRFRVKGQAFVLPKLQYLPLSIAQQLGNLTSEAEAQALIFGRYVPDLMNVASQDELLHVMKRWTDYSKGLSLGE